MFDFTKFAASRGIRTTTTGPRTRPGWTQLQCPKCGTSGSHGGWYLGWNGGGFHCWRCGRMDFKDTLGRLLRTSDAREINAVIAQFQTEKRPSPREIRARPRKAPNPPDLGPLLPAHRKYLKTRGTRGYDPDELEREWGIKGCGRRGGDWAWRIAIPVKDQNGRIISWQGRHVGDAHAKYLFMPNHLSIDDPRTYLYGMDMVDGDTVLVVEGVPSVWRIGTGAVATFGIDYKQEQFHLLRRFKRRFIMFDPEPTATRRAQQLASQLAVFPGETEILSGYDVQPSELPEKEICSLRRDIGLD